jgi:hypothetical protein
MVFTVLEPESIPTIAPATQPSGPNTESLSEISIPLLGESRSIKGVPSHLPQRGMGEGDFLDAQSLTLQSPDGTAIRLLARSSSVICFDDIIRGVFVRRPMRPVTFKEAKAEMLKTLSDLNIAPDATMKLLMSDWPNDAPSYGESKILPHDYQTAIKNRIHGLHLTIRLCPDEAGGWYYYLIFDTPYADPAQFTSPTSGTN